MLCLEDNGHTGLTDRYPPGMEVVVGFVGFVLGTVFGALVTIYLTQRLTKPRLRLTGTSGGGRPAKDDDTFGITLANVPALLGREFGQTIVFGRRLHRRRLIGEPIARNPLENAAAHLYVGTKNDHLLMLWWGPPGSPPSQTVTLKSGEYAVMSLFGREAGRPGEFYVHQPDGANPKLPAENLRFSGDTTFYLRFNHGFGGNQTQWMTVRVTKRPNGRLEIWMDGHTVGSL